MAIKKRYFTLALIAVIFFLNLCVEESAAFWIWTPKSKTFENPKYAVKDTPREQYEWAMYFYKQGDFNRAAEEFVRLTRSYPDSELAPEAQYYAGRSYEEAAKYLFAYQQYQKTIDNYPYTKRLDEIVEREYNIANIFQSKDTSKLMDLELSTSIDRAVEIYAKIVDNSPFGPYADRSIMQMAECYRRMKKYKEAMESYERLIKDYPQSTFVQEAKYQLAYTRYEASLDPEYDQEETEKALKEFKQISETTPIPAIAAEANKVLDELNARKADSELQIAEFYERQKQYTSALMYYREISGKFPGTPAAEYAGQKIMNLEKRIGN
ncbi:MAG: outer membrane protein assembly factor BamD [Candidatus Omnitrophica bacterium]|nr:outer membrane protein assembly factor BamD [Candidatus Omnitrophota bacterium]MDD5488941.1 outer membrane protein assembly factor BamD [Candidatus Omnitrophota bacterium]